MGRTSQISTSARCRAAIAAIAVSFIVLGTSGCLNTATVAVRAPSTTQLPGRGRVALVGVAHDEAGELSKQLSERLGSFAEWEVVGPNELSPIQLASAAGEPSIETVVAHAASADVELLVSAVVREAVVVPPPQWDFLERQPTGQLTVQLAAFSPADADARESHVITKTTTLERGATEISEKAYRRLTAAAIDEFLTSLQPMSASVSLDLATSPMFTAGSRLVRIGNREAHRGRWVLAMEYYERALESNPESDAAIYNLAIAAVANRQFDEAETLALRALRLRPNPIYIEGFDKIKTLAERDATVRYQTGETPE